MVFNQGANQVLDGRLFHFHADQLGVDIATIRTGIGAPLRVELGILDETVFEVVNPKLGRLREADRAEMAGHLHIVAVGAFNDRCQFGLPRTYVYLDAIDPRAFPLLDLQDQGSRIFRRVRRGVYVRTGKVQVWSNFGAGVDTTAEFDFRA